MIELGKFNTLRGEKSTPQGIYLGDGVGNEVLLPNAYIPKGFRVGDDIEVFIYHDSEERPVATTLRPYVIRGEMASLECSNVVPFGAFFRWGLAKELLVPAALQQTPIIDEEERHIVYVMEDEVSGRLVGTTKISRYLDNRDIGELKPGDQVHLMVFGETELGMKVVVEKKYEGLIFHDDIFKPLYIGDELHGYIKKIRSDNKLDIVLEKFGYRKVEPGSEKILQALSDNEGFLPLHDKSDPELIKAKLHMSKKVFKKAIGALYKQRIISIDEKGITRIKSR